MTLLITCFTYSSAKVLTFNHLYIHTCTRDPGLQLECIKKRPRGGGVMTPMLKKPNITNTKITTQLI